jgi:hypothetical protein
VSDGAKCDIARLQMMFGAGVVSAVQVIITATFLHLLIVHSNSNQQQQHNLC